VAIIEARFTAGGVSLTAHRPQGPG
jgi:hypothetical protein